MKNNDALSRKGTIYIKLRILLVILMLFALTYYVIKSVALRSFISIIHHGDIIFYYPMSMACMGAIPFVLYAITLLFRCLFLEKIKPIIEKTFIGKMALPASAVIFFLSLIISYLVPFWLMFSNYEPCHEKPLEYYYVINTELCKTIILQP